MDLSELKEKDIIFGSIPSDYIASKTANVYVQVKELLPDDNIRCNIITNDFSDISIQHDTVITKSDLSELADSHKAAGIWELVELSQTLQKASELKIDAADVVTEDIKQNQPFQSYIQESTQKKIQASQEAEQEAAAIREAEAKAQQNDELRLQTVRNKIFDLRIEVYRIRDKRDEDINRQKISNQQQNKNPNEGVAEIRQQAASEIAVIQQQIETLEVERNEIAKQLQIQRAAEQAERSAKYREATQKRNDETREARTAERMKRLERIASGKTKDNLFNGMHYPENFIDAIAHHSIKPISSQEELQQEFGDFLDAYYSDPVIQKSFDDAFDALDKKRSGILTLRFKEELSVADCAVQIPKKHPENDDPDNGNNYVTTSGAAMHIKSAIHEAKKFSSPISKLVYALSDEDYMKATLKKQAVQEDKEKNPHEWNAGAERMPDAWLAESGSKEFRARLAEIQGMDLTDLQREVFGMHSQPIPNDGVLYAYIKETEYSDTVTALREAVGKHCVFEQTPSSLDSNIECIKVDNLRDFEKVRDILEQSGIKTFESEEECLDEHQHDTMDMTD